MKKTFAAAVALLAGMGAAQAQDVRGVPVTERPRPDFDAIGARAGSFLVKPSIMVSGTFDDNIFAQATGEDDDFISVFAPNLLVASDWNQHYLALRAAAEIGVYQDFSSEDYEDYNFGTDFRLDVTEGDAFSGTVDYRREHDERGSPNDAGGREPTVYDLVYGRLGYERGGRRITLRIAGTLNEYDFKDTPGIGPAILDQDFRDRTEYSLSSRVGYEFREDVVAFVQGTLNWRDYDIGIRNSDGYQIDAGLSFDLGGVTSGEVYAGYREQKYDNALFRDTDGFTFGGNLLWLPSSLTSVQLRLVNEVNESTTANASGFISSGLSVQVDHELLPNVLVGGLVGYTENDYEGVTRVEKLWNAEARVEYLLNRNFRVGANYRLRDREVNAVGQDYTRNQFTLTLRGAL